jgi:hypothetical protein
MNLNLNTISSVIPILSGAFDVIAAFKGNAQEARQNQPVQDAFDVIKSITPLVNTFVNGTEVSPEQVRAALATKSDALSVFDQEIAKQRDAVAKTAAKNQTAAANQDLGTAKT